ncbi:pyridoxamine 5'-phosphate oxidase family protein [bacterium]|nr:pyridoxamine 5'-phosphate oxidase family protein [bacterium]
MNTDDIFGLLDQFSHMTVATIAGDRPQAATVGFSFDLSRNEIYFGSGVDTRKMQNLQKNPSIALVFATPKLGVQIEGQASIASVDEIERIKATHIARNPFSAKFAHNPDQRYVVVRPKWARLTDYRDGESIHEVKWQ